MKKKAHTFIRNLLLLLVLFLPFSRHVVAQTFSPSQCMGFECENCLENCGWNSWVSGSYSIEIDRVVRKSGQGALKLNSLPDHEIGKYASVYNIGTGFQFYDTISFQANVKFINHPDSIVVWIAAYENENLLRYCSQPVSLSDAGNWMLLGCNIVVPPSSNTLMYGVTLYGDGIVWIDDVSVQINNRSPVEIEEERKAKKRENEINVIKSARNLDSILYKVDIGRLTLIGKLWGYLKYHDSIIGNSPHWDYALLEIITKSINSSDEDFANQIESWTEAYRGGSLNVPVRGRNSSSDLHSQINLSWFQDNRLSPEYITFLKRLHEQGTGSSNFVSTTTGLEFTNETSYSDVISRKEYSPTLGVLGFLRFWNNVEYFYPYKDLLSYEWDSILIQHLPIYLNCLTFQDFHENLVKSLLPLKDSHSAVLDDSLPNPYRDYLHPPFAIKVIANRVFVSKFDTIENGQMIPSGAELLEYKDEAVATIIAEYQANTPHSTPQALELFLQYRILLTPDTFVRVKWKNNDSIYVSVFPTKRKSQMPILFQSDSFHAIGSEMYYLNIGNIPAGIFDSVMGVAKKFPNILVDMRDYPSLYGPDFIKHFFKEPIPYISFKIPSREFPGYFYYTTPRNTDTFESPYQGKLFLLLDGGTFSQGETITMALLKYQPTVTIGQATSGSNGDVSILNMPYGLKCAFSGFGAYSDNYKTFQTVGIQPNIVIPTERLLERPGVDVTREYAVEYIISH